MRSSILPLLMQTETDRHPESVNNHLADFLETRKSAILDEWLQRVRKTHPLPENSTRETPVSKRLSSLFEDLNATLRRMRSTPFANDARQDSCVGGFDGSREDFELCEILTDIKHFRSNLVYYLRTFEDLHPDHGMAAMLYVSTVVHLFLDDLMIEVAREFRT